MSDRKQDEIDSMFQATKVSKLEIDSVPKLDKFATILDKTHQGKAALQMAASLAEKFNAELNVIISEDFHEAFKILIHSTQDQLNRLFAFAKEETEKHDLQPNFSTVIGDRIQRVIDEFKEEIRANEILGNKLIKKLEGIHADILFLGVPLYHSSEESEAEHLGGYVTKLLRAKTIKSNVLLVPEKSKPFENSIISFVEVNQQPRSILTLVKRAISIANEETSIRIIGVIEDKLIETMARMELNGEEKETPLPIQEVKEKLYDKLQQTLDSITIMPEVQQVNLRKKVKTGSISEIINIVLENENEGLVMVRSVAEFGENLDPIAEQITRSVLALGFPCLIVWD